jgi:hypothetical protein
VHNYCACIRCIKHPDHYNFDSKARRRDGSPEVRCWWPHNGTVTTAGSVWARCTNKVERLNPHRREEPSHADTD